VPELGSLGSVRGALSNERPYREQPVIAFRRGVDQLGELGRDPLRQSGCG
jgi:hypothetical protein